MVNTDLNVAMQNTDLPLDGEDFRWGLSLHFPFDVIRGSPIFVSLLTA